MIALIGRKIGMTQVFDEAGVMSSTTVIEFDANVVVGFRTKEKDGYEAVILGAEQVKKQRVRKPRLGQFPQGVEPTRHLREVRDFEVACEVGDTLGVEVFDGVKKVDVVGKTKGKGYQGVIKRHGMKGGRKTHGSKFHREGGSTGMSAWPSRVHRGTRMAGRMGGGQGTSQNLEIVRVDADNNLLLVRGAVPGPRKSMVVVCKAKKSRPTRAGE